MHRGRNQQALRLLTSALQPAVTDPLALEMMESQQGSLDAVTRMEETVPGQIRPDRSLRPSEGPSAG